MTGACFNSPSALARHLTQLQGALQILGRPKHAYNDPCVVGKHRSHEKARVSAGVADFIEELFANARDRCLFIAEPLDFPPIEHSELPVFDHGGVNFVAAVGAAKHVAEFIRQLLKMLRRPAEKAELLERGLPLRFPFPLDRLNLEIKNLGRPNDAQRNFLAFVERFEFDPRVMRHPVDDFAACAPIVFRRQWLSQHTDGFKVRPPALAPVVVAGPVIGEPNLDPLILVELLILPADTDSR